MAFKLAALSALIAPASTAWVVQSLPWPQTSHLFRQPDYRDYFSPMLPSTSPFAVFDYGLGARHLYSSPFSARSLFRPRQFSFSRQLDSLADTLDELKTTWKEHAEHVEARLLVRGLRAEQLKAEVSDGVLTVFSDGERKSVSRSLSLPFDVTDASKLTLALDKGVLTVKLPKALRAPAKAKTSLQIVAAEPSEEKKEPEALPTPTPTPTAVEEETLRALEKKFPQASASESGVKEPSDSDAAAPAAAAEPVPEQRDATGTLRKVIHTAIGATSMAADGKQAAKNNSEAAPAETVATA